MLSLRQGKAKRTPPDRGLPPRWRPLPESRAAGTDDFAQARGRP